MNGFILVNKQKDVSSNFVVQEIKKKIKAKKVGHTGTLDPLASGLLVLAIDRATNFQVTSLSLINLTMLKYLLVFLQIQMIQPEI